MPQNVNLRIDSVFYRLDTVPDECPVCGKGIKIQINNDFVNANGYTLTITSFCPYDECGSAIFLDYSIAGDLNVFTKGCDLINVYPARKIENRKFSDIITEISDDFIKIYNQAFCAEELKLTDICGMGYRKALEFLIKDYAIKNHHDKKEKIEKLFLANCIEDYISDTKIKEAAKRAVWLGNDETHFVRKWTAFELKDLKKLIDVTIHCIEAEAEYKKYMDSMPEGK